MIERLNKVNIFFIPNTKNIKLEQSLLPLFTLKTLINSLVGWIFFFSSSLLPISQGGRTIFFVSCFFAIGGIKLWTYCQIYSCFTLLTESQHKMKCYDLYELNKIHNFLVSPRETCQLPCHYMVHIRPYVPLIYHLF